MRKMLCVALMLSAGCDEPKSPQAKTAAAGQSMIRKQVIVKPGTKSLEPGLIMAVSPNPDTNWFSPLKVEAFRAVVLDELPEVYVDGKIDDDARWLVKVEDGPAAGKTVAVYKKLVDLISIE